MLINVLRDEAPTHLAVAFDVVAPTFRSEAYAEYKANRSKTPGRVPRPGQPDQGGARRAARSRSSTPTASRPTTSSPPSPRRPRPRACDVLIVTGDRDAFQLVDDRVTVLYPRKGVSRDGADDPGGGRGEVRPDAGAVPRLRRAAAATRATTCPAIPGVGEKTGDQVGPRVRLAGPLVDRVDEVKGKAGDALRANLADVLRNRQLTELVRDVPLDGRPARSRSSGSGTATRCTRSSTRCSSACCATGSTPTLASERARGRAGLRGRRRAARAPASVGRLARRARAGRLAHRARRRRAPGAGARGDVTGLAVAGGRRAARLGRPGRS